MQSEVCCRGSKWGEFAVVASERGVTRVVLPRGNGNLKSQISSLGSAKLARRGCLADRVAGKIRRYLEGERVVFDEPVDYGDLPPRFVRILEECRRIPCGATLSYRELASRAGNPRLARTVGQAMARNPVPVMIPCHRVIRSDGSPGGFSAGAALKIRLLGMEAHAPKMGAGLSGPA